MDRTEYNSYHLDQVPLLAKCVYRSSYSIYVLDFLLRRPCRQGKIQEDELPC